MTFDLFLGLCTYAAIGAHTPGPNNTLLLASGMNHGFRRTLPQMMGVSFGFPAMVACLGLGLGEVFTRFPAAYTALKVAGAAYLLWLAWKIATSQRASEETSTVAKPVTFMQAVLFQWVNPKAWIMGISSIAAFTIAATYYRDLAIVLAVVVVMGLSSSAIWASFGVSLRHLLADARYYRWINLGLAALLMLSLIPMLRH